MRSSLPRLLHTSTPFLRPIPSLPLHLATPTKPLPPAEPTTFSGKSSPRQVHERPEAARGIPSFSSPISTPSRPIVNRGDERAEAFAGPSRPRLMYGRPEERELPSFKNRVPLYILLGVVGVSAWGLFVVYATNAERVASSVVRQLSFQIRNSPQLAAVLGDNVRPSSNWWSFGDPYISGVINNMQGRVDLKFRVTGTQGDGTLYFTSIRPKQEGAWRIVRFKVIADSGETVMLEDAV